MAHTQQRQFVEDVARLLPSYFMGTRVLEIGSRDIDGSLRDLFQAPAHYLGLDAHPGPGVDVVGLAHELTGESCFDVCVAAEVFEHDPHFSLTVRAMVRLLVPGGLFLATWASPKREEHGTTRSGGGDFGPDPDYYRAPRRRELLDLLDDSMETIHLSEGWEGQDYYAWAVKRKPLSES